MPRQFLATKPLQACKLAVVIGTLVFAGLGFFRIVPDQQLRVLLLLAVLGPALTLVVLAETLFAGYRVVRADDSPADRLTAHPAYTAVRAGEVIITLLAAGAFVVIIGTLPDEPLPGPGAIGLLFMGVVLGLVALGAILVRTLTEYYLHRRGPAVN
ncbi:hypothetical protein ACERIT_01155 [Halopenitus sp. H-Gu1]|uniref:hypothetical protein n=1 Tax=Halopenitus sp. H-Gu1 TaxID=3242697 RepID=UPI00359DED9E